MVTKHTVKIAGDPMMAQHWMMARYLYDFSGGGGQDREWYMYHQ